jgi:PAS domain S-box-containing protein
MGDLLRFPPLGVVSDEALMITLLRDGTYVAINDYFLEHTGYTREEVIGKTPFDLNLWVDPEERLKLAEAVRTHTPVLNLKVRYRTKSGATRTALTSSEYVEIDGEPCMRSIAIALG